MIKMNNKNIYIGFDPKYLAYGTQKLYRGDAVRDLLKEDSELDKLSLQDIYAEIEKRKGIYSLNSQGLLELDCKIGTRLFDFNYFPQSKERISLEMEQIRLQEKIFDERASYFRDTMRLRELALEKKESIRNDESHAIDDMLI